MAIVKAVSSSKKLGEHKTPPKIGRVLDYVLNKEKTQGIYIDGIGCNPATVKEEMRATKELWNKTTGREQMHYVMSYAPEDNITPEQALKNAREVVENTPCMNGFEILLATHTDTDHIHTHIVVNTVNWEDGHKYQMSPNELQAMKDFCIQQSKAQGLHIPEKGKHFDGTPNENAVAWKQGKYRALERADTSSYKSYVLDVAKAVIDVRELSISRADFVERLKKRGIDTKWSDTRKYIVFSLKHGEDTKKVRNSNLEKTFGIDFSKEGLELEFETNHQGRGRQEAGTGSGESDPVFSDEGGTNQTIGALLDGTKEVYDRIGQRKQEYDTIKQGIIPEPARAKVPSEGGRGRGSDVEKREKERHQGNDKPETRRKPKNKGFDR
ncbi:MAG: relaxase/mobilization nuclease domain-containing protein [Eubacteriales bacterium]